VVAEQAAALSMPPVVLVVVGVLLVLLVLPHNDQVERAVLLVTMFLVAHTSLGW
jgi:hypothetical protein